MAAHFLLYYDHRLREVITTTPRTWAKCNQGHFPGFDFANNHPTVDVIENYLAGNHGFVQEPHEDYIVMYNFSDQIPAINGLPFIL